MGHLLNAAKHAAYVFAVAFLGSLGLQDGFLSSISTIHGAELALGPAALAALAKVAQSTGLLSALASAGTTAPAAPVSALAPDATDQ